MSERRKALIPRGSHPGARAIPFALAALACILPAGAAAQVPQGSLTLQLEAVADGLAAPVDITGAGDGTGRLFIADQTGLVRVIENGVLLSTPFLDISGQLPALGTFFDERGLLGIAFHPDYATNGRFFVRYSAPRAGLPTEPCNDPDGFIVGCHSEVLSEFHVSATDPNVADPDSEIILFTADKPQFNHNGGDLAFGPDGFLYFALGDGGGAHDGLADVPPSHGPIGNAQNLDAALGKMHRIDVDGGVPYAIPPGNPFVGLPGLDEIWAYGLRNPYRFSFDSLTGTLWLGDVGQNIFEEVDIIVGGGNYGWVIREGAHCFDPFDPTVPPATCTTAGLIDPVAEYDHGDGLSVIGGTVYRGSGFAALSGLYLFADFSRDFGPTGRIFYLDPAGTPGDIFEARIGLANAPLGMYLKGTGEDDAGEIYLLASDDLAPGGTSGIVFRVVEPREFIRGDTNDDGVVDIGDAIHALEHLFAFGPLGCRDAGDANDDGQFDVADPVTVISFLFSAGAPIPAPYPGCGLDPTADLAPGGDLGCSAASSCP